MASLPADDIDGAKRALDESGFVVLENAVPGDSAARLAQAAPAAPTRLPGVAKYEFAVALLNHDAAFLELAMHPTLLALARHLIGGRTEPGRGNYFTWPPEDQVRLGSVDGLIAHPGSEAGFWHMDSPMGQLSDARPLPDFPVLVNAIWMLTPFREDTGATRVVPGSHRRRRLPPGTQDTIDGQVTACGEPGSVVIVPNTTWHASGINRAEQPRIAVACNYQPWWVGRLTMDVYPIQRDVWETLPPDAQALTKHQLEWNTDFRREPT